MAKAKIAEVETTEAAEAIDRDREMSNLELKRRELVAERNQIKESLKAVNDDIEDTEERMFQLAGSRLDQPLFNGENEHD